MGEKDEPWRNQSVGTIDDSAELEQMAQMGFLRRCRDGTEYGEKGAAAVGLWLT
jgi:hypothetical protein